VAGLHHGALLEAFPEWRNGVRPRFILGGRVVAPKSQRGRSIQLWVSPVGPEVRFGPEDLDEVGRIQRILVLFDHSQEP
jgi:hypothetical protein